MACIAVIEFICTVAGEDDFDAIISNGTTKGIRMHPRQQHDGFAVNRDQLVGDLPLFIRVEIELLVIRAKLLRHLAGTAQVFVVLIKTQGVSMNRPSAMLLHHCHDGRAVNAA